jgi:hypothetical protein
MRRKFHLSNPKKCKKTGKTQFNDEKKASFAMMRMWSHDPSVNIYDMHTYVCPDCLKWHIGHISYYEKSKAKNGTTGISSNLP